MNTSHHPIEMLRIYYSALWSSSCRTVVGLLFSVRTATKERFDAKPRCPTFPRDDSEMAMLLSGVLWESINPTWPHGTIRAVLGYNIPHNTPTATSPFHYRLVETLDTAVSHQNRSLSLFYSKTTVPLQFDSSNSQCAVIYRQHFDWWCDVFITDPAICRSTTTPCVMLINRARMVATCGSHSLPQHYYNCTCTSLWMGTTCEVTSKCLFHSISTTPF